MIRLPGGTFLMGSEDGEGFAADGEGPVREVVLSPFSIDAHCVSNARFAAFVDATSHRTDAERFGWSYVFASFLPGRLRAVSPRPEGTPWWCGVEGAHWRAPEGPGSDVADRPDHPVVHVSWNDAMAYCRWEGSRLPTEAEWEYAARGGLEQRRYPWGDELEPGGQYLCNIWHGRFPTHNTAEDGYRGTAPVDAFPPNGFGLHNVSGNVWERVADRWSAGLHASGARRDPTGPREGADRVMRGGSYLCHDSYCNRYRVAARTSTGPDESAGNAGFRVARS
jgi:formylglycine-generating enzyme required for sulfatase activity